MTTKNTQKPWHGQKRIAKTNEGDDFKNRPEKRKNREQKNADWEFVVKMMIIMRDLMTGNPKLKEMGFKEEALGHNAIAAGFQGQRQWTDWKPNGDFRKHCLTPLSTGTVSAKHTFWLPKMMLAMVLPCYSVTC